MEQWNLPEFFSFQGRAVRYGVIGNGPPLVCVHGTPWSSFNMRHLIKKLSGLHTVYFYDLLGYGQSDKALGDVSLGIQNEVLSQLLDHWGLESPVIVGHDFGGATSLRTHLLNGRPFQKMILIDPVAVAPWGSPFFRHVTTYEAAFAGVPDYIHESIVRAYVQTAAFSKLDDETLERIILPWTGEEGRKAFYRQIAQADQSHTDEVQILYRNVSVPVLIIWGREDSWIPVLKGQELRSLIPGSTLRIIDDAGHLVLEEKPAEIFLEIVSFLSG